MQTNVAEVYSETTIGLWKVLPRMLEYDNIGTLEKRVKFLISEENTYKCYLGLK